MAKTNSTPDDVPGPEQARTKVGYVQVDDTEGHAHTKTGYTDQPGPEQARTKVGYEDSDDDTEGHAHTKQ